MLEFTSSNENFFTLALVYISLHLCGRLG